MATVVQCIDDKQILGIIHGEKKKTKKEQATATERPVQLTQNSRANTACINIGGVFFSYCCSWTMSPSAAPCFLQMTEDDKLQHSSVKTPSGGKLTPWWMRVLPHSPSLQGRLSFTHRRSDQCSFIKSVHPCAPLLKW